MDNISGSHKGRISGIFTQPEVTHALRDFDQSVRVKVDIEYCIHLTIDSGPAVEIDQDENYDREAGQARNGVNLSRGWI